MALLERLQVGHGTFRSHDIQARSKNLAGVGETADIFQARYRQQ